MGEGFAADAAFGFEEGEHLRVLVEGEADGGGGAAEGKDEAEVGRLGLHWRHRGYIETLLPCCDFLMRLRVMELLIVASVVMC